MVEVVNRKNQVLIELALWIAQSHIEVVLVVQVLVEVVNVEVQWMDQDPIEVDLEDSEVALWEFQYLTGGQVSAEVVNTEVQWKVKVFEDQILI